MTCRGRIQLYTSNGDGIVAVDGKQFSFQLMETWKSEMPPRVGMLVDVAFNSQGAPETIVIVPDSQVAREQANAALSAAKLHGAEMTGNLKRSYRVSFLMAQAVLLLSFFVLPSASIAFVGRSVTAWDLLGMDVGTMSLNDHGLLSLFAVVCLFAPLMVPFLKTGWSRLLYLAPLGFSVVALGTVSLQIANAGHAAMRSAEDTFGASAARELGRGAMSLTHPGIGIPAVLLCSAYIAMQIRRAAA